MDGFELLATITGLFLGYWLVSSLLNRGNQESTSGQNKKEDSRQTFQEDRGHESKLWHEILEISPTATFDEVSTAYKRKISKYHPDKVNSLGEEFRELADKRAKEINAAYDQAKKHFGY